MWILKFQISEPVPQLMNKFFQPRYKPKDSVHNQYGGTIKDFETGSIWTP